MSFLVMARTLVATWLTRNAENLGKYFVSQLVDLDFRANNRLRKDRFVLRKRTAC